MKRKIAAILAADIAGYSRLVSEDEEETLLRLESLRAVFDDFVLRFGGRIFNKAGDAILAEFSSAVDATRCAIDIQESMRTRNLAYPQTRRMEFRIGITIGDVVERDGDLLGDGVNIAARLEGLAEPGGICVSRIVYEAVVNKLSVPFLDIGRQEVKNLPQPVHAFRVDWKSDGRRPATSSSNNGKRRVSAIVVALFAAATGVAAAAIVGALMVWRSAQTPQAPVTTEPTIAIAPNSPTTSAPQPLDKPALPHDPAEAFALLARQGGIVQNATTAPEIYHNARSYERRGEALQARQSYLAFANLDLDLIDPLLRFAALLRVQEGRAGAREVFAALSERHRAPAFRLALAMQFEGPERLKRLEGFIAENPAYAPAYALLAEEFSETRVGNVQTFGNMKKERASLEKFLEDDHQGRLQPFFLDHSALAEWIDRARKRHAALEQTLATQMTQPNIYFSRHNTGWNVTVQLPEAASSFAWRLSGEQEFRSPGATTSTDFRTGKPSPITWFELPEELEHATIEVRYEDASGRMNGPFSFEFDWRKAIINGQRQILEQFATAWVQFGKGTHFDDLLYFTHLVSYRCAIAKAEIGFDGEAPSQALPLPECDRRDPLSVPSSAKTYLRLPAKAKSASVRLTYADGGQSSVTTYQRPQ